MRRWRANKDQCETQYDSYKIYRRTTCRVIYEMNDDDLVACHLFILEKSNIAFNLSFAIKLGKITQRCPRPVDGKEMIRVAREDFIILTAENLDAFDTRTADHVVIPRLRRLNELYVN